MYNYSYIGSLNVIRYLDKNSINEVCIAPASLYCSMGAGFPDYVVGLCLFFSPEVLVIPPLMSGYLAICCNTGKCAAIQVNMLQYR